MVQFSPEERTQIWDRLATGQSMRSIARGLGRQSSSVRQLVRRTGGVAPPMVKSRSSRFLSLAEREEISRGVLAGLSCRAIAAQLRRSPSTISREIKRNGSPNLYRAHLAEGATVIRARRPKSAKLALNPMLRGLVEAKLELRWSPQQISAWLSMIYPDNKEMHVSHETIYMSLFVQGRGGLRRELHKALRTGRALRRRRGPYPYEGQGHIPAMVLISGIQINFCDLRSPWQRGSNENTNGLLRQYLPKGTDLSIHTEADLDAIAEELNNRPRQTLGWVTPLEKFAEVVAMTA